MPLYVYKCRECEDEFTKKRMIADRKEPTLFPCPSCNADETLYIKVQPTKMSYQGNMKTSNNFNSRLKEIKQNIPPAYHGGIDDQIR